MIIGVGTDLVENYRIKRALERHGLRFLSRVFTKEEIILCTGSKGLRLKSLAARFAGKEAVAKALGTGVGVISWREMEITSDDLGAPLVSLSGRARERAKLLGIRDIKLSLSHARDYSLAFAVASSQEV